MNFFVKVDGTKKLCYKLGLGQAVDEEQLYALRELKLSGLIPIEKKSINAEVEFDYAIGGMEPLGQYLQRQFKTNQPKDVLIVVLETILKLIDKVEEYPLLSSANIVLELEQIWADARGNIHFVYLPLKEDYMNTMAAWNKLLTDLLDQTDDKEAAFFLFEEQRSIKSLTDFSSSVILKQIKAEGGANISSKAMPKSDRVKQPHITPKAPVQEVRPIPPKATPEPTNKPVKPVQNVQYQASNQVATPVNKEVEYEEITKIKKRDMKKLFLGHIALVAILSAMIFSGIMRTKAGNLDILNVILAVVLLVGGLAFIWFRFSLLPEGEQVVVQKKVKKNISKKTAKKSEKKAKKAKVSAPAAVVPGMVEIGGASLVPGMDAKSAASAPVKKDEEKPDKKAKIFSKKEEIVPEPYVNVHVRAEAPVAPQAMAEGTVIFSDNAENNNEEGTVFLEEEVGAYLRNQKTGEKKLISAFPFRIGRKAEGWTILDKAVSGIHCQIDFENSQYYLVDLQSKNGTSLNNQKLEANKYYPLSNGDRFVIGSTEIIFES